MPIDYAKLTIDNTIKHIKSMLKSIEEIPPYTPDGGYVKIWNDGRMSAYEDILDSLGGNEK